MNITNPYEAGWNNGSGSAPQPSIFGALPFSSQPSAPSIHTFYFTAFNPDILDCTVVGSQSQTYFRISNNTPTPNFTLFQDRDGKAVAVIEWRHAPGSVVEIRNIIRKQLTSSWLRLSGDQTHRFMDARDRSFVWVPQKDYVGLYTYGTSTPELYARVTRTSSSATLEMTSTAIQLGLLECCVVAVVLLQSGRRID